MSLGLHDPVKARGPDGDPQLYRSVRRATVWGDDTTNIGSSGPKKD